MRKTSGIKMQWPPKKGGKVDFGFGRKSKAQKARWPKTLSFKS